MKIKILASASQDLIDGYRFYESQAEGVGAYFLDSLYSDIDSLMIGMDKEETELDMRNKRHSHGEKANHD